MFDSIGKTLKGLVYEDTPDSPAPPAKGSAPTSMSSMTSPSQLPQDAGVNQEMVSAIKKVTFGRNTAFTQLLAASEALADVIPDQVMRLKAAHKTAGGGRTGQQIAAAVDVHLQDVDGEEMRFAAAVKQKVDTEVAGIETQARLAEQQLQAANAEIQQAQQRIATLQSSIAELSSKASQAQAQVAQKRSELELATGQFKLAANAVRNELNGSKSAILSTLV